MDAPGKDGPVFTGEDDQRRKDPRRPRAIRETQREQHRERHEKKLVMETVGRVFKDKECDRTERQRGHGRPIERSFPRRCIPSTGENAIDGPKVDKRLRHEQTVGTQKPRERIKQNGNI